MKWRFGVSLTCDDSAQIQKLQKNVEHLARLEVVAHERRDACARIKRTVESDLDADIRKTYEAEIRKADQAAARMRVARNRHVMQVAKLLNTDDDDDDLAVVGAVSTGKCPIMATPLTNPRKNSACGHVYSAEGALMLLNQTHKRNFNSLEQVPHNFTAPCPVARCTRTFNSGTLARDYAAEHSQRLRSATHNTEEDDDEIFVQ